MSTKQSKWVIPGAILVAAIIGWFFYDAYHRESPPNPPTWRYDESGNMVTDENTITIDASGNHD